MAINFVTNSFITFKPQWKTKKFKLVLTVTGFLLPLFKGEAEVWNTVIRKVSFLFLAKKKKTLCIGLGAFSVCGAL